MTEESGNGTSGKRVGIWLRVSTEDQVKGESLEHHEQRARFYAHSKGWHIVEVYRLDAVSGKSVIDHPEAKRMIRDIERGRITGLIFSKLARLARNTKELLEFSEIFQQHGADLISLGESMDTSTPMGRFYYTLMGAMGQWEREETSSRVAASVPIRAKMGKSTGGMAPFGYMWKDQKLVHHPEEAPVRKRIYELFVELRRFKAVCRALNDAGFRTRKGKKFTDSEINRLLRDTIAIGERRVNYTKSQGKDKSWVLKPESEWIYQEVEPLISEDLWAQVQQILSERAIKRTPPGRMPVHLFSGLVVCECGQKMYVPSNSPKYICKKCRTKVPVGDLEEIYIEKVKGFLLSPTEIAGYLREANATIAEKEDLLEALGRERGKVQDAMDDAWNLYSARKVTMDQFEERHRPHETRMAEIKEAIPRLQAEIDFLKINFLSSDVILTEAQDLYGRWPQLDFPAKRKIVENITDRIHIGRDTIHIELCYLPSSEDMAKRQHLNTGCSSPQVCTTPGRSRSAPSA